MMEWGYVFIVLWFIYLCVGLIIRVVRFLVVIINIVVLDIIFLYYIRGRMYIRCIRFLENVLIKFVWFNLDYSFELIIMGVIII